MFTQITNTDIPPYCAIGYLAMHWSTGNWAYGTGALIDNRHVLTCSHNLIDQITEPMHGQADEILFYPKYNDVRTSNPPPGGLQIEVGFYSMSFVQGEDAWDVGLCRLQAPLNDPLPPFFTVYPTDGGIIHESVTLAGYPGGVGEMWMDIDEVAEVDLPTNTMVYTNDTLPGNSGSPVWTYDPITDRTLQHGIHVSRQPQELRRGILITAAVQAWILLALQRPTPPAQVFQLVPI